MICLYVLFASIVFDPVIIRSDNKLHKVYSRRFFRKKVGTLEVRSNSVYVLSVFQKLIVCVHVLSVM